MDRICQRASRVIAWMGRDGRDPASDGEMNSPIDIESAFDFANLLLRGSQSTQYYNRNVWYYPTPSLEYTATASQTGTLKPVILDGAACFTFASGGIGVGYGLFKNSSQQEK
jgi:hypothetical protein